ncbi:unnamed protein product [Sphagnum balticum]
MQDQGIRILCPVVKSDRVVAAAIALGLRIEISMLPHVNSNGNSVKQQLSFNMDCSISFPDGREAYPPPVQRAHLFWLPGFLGLRVQNGRQN